MALAFAIALAIGCDKPPSVETTEAAPAAAETTVVAAEPMPSASASAEVAPETPGDPSNPLGLPPSKITLEGEKRLFTFSERMLRGAKPGSTLILYAATALGFEGDDLLIEGSAGGPSYKVHPAYAIAVPDNPRPRPGDPVLTEWNGTMKHAVVTKLVKDRVGVRYTDMEGSTPEPLLRHARIVKQTAGLSPGNYAAVKEGDEWRHVLLVSRFQEGEKARWLALGFGGAALLLDDAALREIPIRFAPKVGAEVWAEWVGTLRKGTVQSADETGLFTVKFERAGRPVTVGWGMLMAPLPD